MTKSIKKIRIFVASPSDVTNERIKLETVVDSLGLMADYLGLTLEVVDWRDVVPDAGRPQQIIFDQLKPTSWDIFIGILWHRFGTPPGAKDKTEKDYLSGTEEEFKTAYELWKQHGRPRIVLYRCTRALPFDVDPDQLKRVREFFKLIEDVKGDFPTLYQAFDTTESFEKLVLDNLQKLLFEYGEKSEMPITPDVAQVLAPIIPNNLPRRPAFFGRADEMEIIMRALSPADRTWGVLVDGIGGIGKTALAVEAAHRSQDASAFDAFILVTAKKNILVPEGIRKQKPAANTLAEFFTETARVLGQNISKLSEDEKRIALLDILRTKRSLLIYDNLETLSKEEQEAMADFLRELPQGSKAIITSRRRGGEGAVWLRVGKLDWEAVQSIIENEVSRDTNLENKLRRVERRWYELYDETSGSPLALMHILGLLRVRTTLTFDGALAMLRGVHRKDDLVNFVYQEARKELTANDKATLGALSFFVPSASFTALMQVADLSRNALETTIDRLSALSLVDALAGAERYSIHPLTRTYIRDDLITDKKLAEKLEAGFMNYWIGYVAQGAENRNNSFDLFEEEWFNIKATIEWLLKKSRGRKNKIKNEEIARLFFQVIDLLQGHLYLSGRWDERKKICSYGYDMAIILREMDIAGWCAYHVAWVDGVYGRNLPLKAKPWIDKCAKVWSKSEAADLRMEAVRLRGLIAMQNKRYKIAERYLKDALSLSRRGRNRSDSMNVLNDLGMLAFENERYSIAKRNYKNALEIANAIKSNEGKAFTKANIGDVALKQKNNTEANKMFRSSLPLAQKVGRVDLVARINCGLAIVWESRGYIEKALSLAKDGLMFYQKLHHPNKLVAQELVNRLEKSQ